MADENIVIGVDLKDDFTAPARRVVKSLDDIGDEATSTSARFNLVDESIESTSRSATAAQGRIRGLTRRVKDLGRESIKSAAAIKILDSAIGRLDRMNRGGGGGAGGANRRNRDSGRPGMGMVAGIGGMPLTMFIGIASTIAALLPMISAALAALGAAAIGAIGALSPLIGLLATGVGIYMAFGQAIGTVALALKGMGEAVGAVRDTSKTIQEVRAELFKFNEYGGRNFANKFVRNISRIGTEFEYLRTGIQTMMLPTLNQFVNAGRTLLPTLQAGFKETAKEINGVVKETTAFIKTSQAQRQIASIMSANAKAAGNLGGAMSSGFRVLLNILEAAAPILIRITQDIENFVDKLSIASTVNTAPLSQFFESTYSVLRNVVKFATDLSVALYNIGKIGTPLGSAMGNSFRTMAENFRKFTESAAGAEQIRQWFIQMTPIVYEMGYLIRDVAKSIAMIGMDDSIIGVSKQFREELLPVIVDFIGQVNSNLLPVLLKVIQAIVEFIAAFDMLGGVIKVIDTLATALLGIARFIDVLPGPIKAIIGLFVAFMFTLKATIVILNMLYRAKIRAALAARTLGMSIRGMMLATGAVGIALVAIGAAIEAFTGRSDEAAASSRAWAESLYDVNGALVENAAQITASELSKMKIPTIDIEVTSSGPRGGGMQTIKRTETALFDLANAAGVMNKDVVDAVTGTDEAYEALRQRLLAYAKENQKVGQQNGGEVYNNTMKLVEGLDTMRGTYVGVGSEAEDYRETIGQLLNPTERLAKATENLNRGIQRLKGLLTERASTRQYLSDLEALRQSLKDNGTSFNKFTEEGRSNLAAIDQVYSTTIDRVNSLLERGNTARAIELMRRTKRDLASIAEELPPGARKAINKQMGLLNGMLNDIVKKAETVQTQKWYTRINQDVDFRRRYMHNGRPVGSLKAAMEAMPEVKAPTVQMNVTGTVDIKNIDVVTSTTQGLVDNLMIVGSRHDPKVSATQITNAKTQADLLEDKLLQLTGKTWNVVVNYTENRKRAHGGPVMSGINYTVGELGPEAFIGKSGNVTMIGVNGQQQKTFNEDGWVVPNSQLASAMAGLADSGPQRSEYEIGGGGPVINIGTINASNEIDVIKAVKKGIAEAERNRRERS